MSFRAGKPPPRAADQGTSGKTSSRSILGSPHESNLHVSAMGAAGQSADEVHSPYRAGPGCGTGDAGYDADCSSGDDDHSSGADGIFSTPIAPRFGYVVMVHFSSQVRMGSSTSTNDTGQLSDTVAESLLSEKSDYVGIQERIHEVNTCIYSK